MAAGEMSTSTSTGKASIPSRLSVWSFASIDGASHAKEQGNKCSPLCQSAVFVQVPLICEAGFCTDFPGRPTFQVQNECFASTNEFGLEQRAEIFRVYSTPSKVLNVSSHSCSNCSTSAAIVVTCW